MLRMLKTKYFLFIFLQKGMSPELLKDEWV